MRTYGWPAVTGRGEGCMRRGDVIMSGYVAVVCAAIGLVFWLVLAPHSSAAGVAPAPGGTYTSVKFHFAVTYPAGWQASTGDGGVPGAWVTPATTGSAAAATPIPLVVTITRAGQVAGSSTTSSLTITVWDLNNPTAAAQAGSLAKNTALHATTLAGVSGYAAPPVAQPLPGKSGATTSITDTHTDYYVVHGGYEYQLTTDAISGDNAGGALQGMLASFRLSA
jgi:hypothetical protein